MVDSINNSGSVGLAAWFESHMPNCTPDETDLFMKQETGAVNAFQSQVNKLHEDNKKTTEELTKE